MPPPIPVAPGVWRITTPLPFRPRSVHAYLVRGSEAEGWMLVDGGIESEAAWAALDAGVRAVAGDWGDVRLHLVTHMHQDHIGLWARVRDACGAPMAMGRLDAERVAHAAREPEEEAEYRRRLLRENGAPVELHPPGGGRPAPAPTVQHPLPESDAPCPGFGGWVSVWTPGHTAGHLSLLRPEDGVLLAGDAVLPRITPTLGVNRQREDPVGDYLDALERLRALRPRLGLAGHGEPIADPTARIDALRAEADAEGGRIASLLGEAPASAWEVARARYAERDLPASAWMQALRETRAHLDRLERRGRARREWRDGVACFARPFPPPRGSPGAAGRDTLAHHPIERTTVIKVGLTGNVASGKSSVARVWRELGAPVIDADALARRAVEPGSEALARIVVRWGERVLRPSGELDRAALRDIVFRDPAERAALEEIVHPAVARLREEEYRRAEESGAKLVVADIPLLFEVGLQDEFDLIVLVDAPSAVRRERMLRDRGLGEAEARRMIDAQMPAERKRPAADFVIDNTGTPSELREAATRVWTELRERAAEGRP